jgi:hypothetical protein
MKKFTTKSILRILFLAFLIGIAASYYKFTQPPTEVSNNITTLSGKITPLYYTNSTLLNNFNKKNIDEYQTAAGTYDIQTIASQMTSTLLTAFSISVERPLPLIANWNVGIPEYSDGLDPLYMINRLTDGEHLLPTWKLDPYFDNTIGLNYYETSVKKAAELGLPLVFILPSPESALTQDDVYFNMDKTQNPNVITVNGTVLPELSPFGPDSLWKEVGGQWSTTTLMTQLQEWYPNPPLVVFVDEDASKKLSWSNLATSSRYIEHYPTNTSNEFKRTLVNAKWLEKYRQLHEGFKQGFTKKAWKQNVKFLTRNQLASNMGVTADWINSSTTTNQHANIWPLTADGLTINFNLDGDKTDTTDAPHTLLNNLPFMLEEAKELNPNFTYQLSIDANQKIDNPQRYRGFTQFALWFLRPSIIRQTPNKTTKAEINPLFQQVVDSVELIHNSDVLADFWKNGKLVSTGSSNYTQNIPTNYQSIPREFLLKTDATSPVWAFALKKGKAPNREWLIYIQSPEENLSDITVAIPNYNNVNLDATQNGYLYIINEGTQRAIETSAGIATGTTKTNLDTNISNIQTWFEKDGIIYGAKPDDRGPIGGGKGYSDIITSGDFTVTTYSELKQALSEAKSGQIIFLPSNVKINFDGKKPLDIPSEVTIASDRGYNNSSGAHLYKTILKNNDCFFLIETAHTDIRISGLKIEGPDKETLSIKYNNIKGIRTWGNNTTIDNCEIFGFPSAAIDIGNSTNNAYIHHNFIHHNQRTGLGYAILINKSNALIEYNRFNLNRHDVSGNGNPKSFYIARYNISGINTNAYYDMHGDFKNGYGGNAGKFIEIYNNYIPYKGKQNYAINIRGIPVDGPAKIHNNIFGAWKNDFPCIINSQEENNQTTNQTLRNSAVLIYNNVFRNKL